MDRKSDFLWRGEKSRPLGVYRPCPCGICRKNRKGVEYLSFSDAEGNGFTIWMKNEKVFRKLKRALRSQ
jgi:hypothetical protein